MTRWTNLVREGSFHIHAADASQIIGRVASRYGANNEMALAAYHSFQLSPQPGHLGDELFSRYRPRSLSRSVAEHTTRSPGVSQLPFSMDGRTTHSMSMTNVPSLPTGTKMTRMGPKTERNSASDPFYLDARLFNSHSFFHPAPLVLGSGLSLSCHF